MSGRKVRFGGNLEPGLREAGLEWWIMGGSFIWSSPLYFFQGIKKLDLERMDGMVAVGPSTPLGDRSGFCEGSSLGDLNRIVVH